MTTDIVVIPKGAQTANENGNETVVLHASLTLWIIPDALPEEIQRSCLIILFIQFLDGLSFLSIH